MISKIQARRSLHEKYRAARKFFYSKAKAHRLRTRDGGGKDHNRRKVWFEFVLDGKVRKVNAEEAERIESKLRRGLTI